MTELGNYQIKGLPSALFDIIQDYVENNFEELYEAFPELVSSAVMGSGNYEEILRSKRIAGRFLAYNVFANISDTDHVFPFTLGVVHEEMQDKYNELVSQIKSGKMEKRWQIAREVSRHFIRREFSERWMPMKSIMKSINALMNSAFKDARSKKVFGATGEQGIESYIINSNLKMVCHDINYGENK